MHILITGGAGFIGSHLADDLLRHGHRVRVLDNLTPQVHGATAVRPDYLDEDVELIRGDVEDVSVGGPRRGSNRVVGNARANKLTLIGRGQLDGGGGDDTISVDTDRALGGPGDDTMIGSGNVFGGPGDDTLTAAGGTFHGGAGADRIEKAKPSTGETTSARMFGEAGNDTIDATDTVCITGGEPGRLFVLFGGCLTSAPTEPVTVRDRISCGPGSDTATLGAGDASEKSCERVRRPR